MRRVICYVATCFGMTCDSNAKIHLLPSPIATVVATCFDITSDMNGEDSLLGSKIASRVSFLDREVIESYPSRHFLASKVSKSSPARLWGASGGLGANSLILVKSFSEI